MGKVLFESKNCKAEYIAEKKTVKYTIEGHIHKDENKEMYLKVLEFMKSNVKVAFLHDFRQMKGTFTHLSTWIVDNFRPATQWGLKYEAMIMNDDAYGVASRNEKYSTFRI